MGFGRNRWVGSAVGLFTVTLCVWLSPSAARSGFAPNQPSATGTSTKAFSTTKHSSPTKPKIVPRSWYVGDAVCGQCHQDIFATYEKTAHNLTSQLATKNSVVGTFAPGENTMTTANPNLSFRMDERDGQFFQTAIWTSPDGAAPRTRTERLDLVTGSGGKGQSYLYWRDNQLFQLPAGYSTVLHRWINSPGYADGSADFERPIIPRCLECHATYFEPVFPDPDVNMYNTINFQLGISCERCHGPGRAHAQSYTTRNRPPATGDIVNPAKLSPARQADVCAQCHGGQGDRFLEPAFSYVPGEPLSDYIDLGPIDSSKDVDVHGKQVKLLLKSRCYQMSSNMNCSTCHDVHRTQRDLTAMSQHCLGCHKVDTTLPTHAKIGAQIIQNCIDCHMPKLPSQVVSIPVDGKTIRPRFRTHWIKVYSEQERQ
jgi:hypothetical protein